MKILKYIIPKDLQKNNFMLSLKAQFEKSGELSKRQKYALEDMLEIELDFYDWSFELPEDSDPSLRSDFDELMKKLKLNRFRKIKTRNKCIRAIESIIQNKTDKYLVDDALGRLVRYGYRRY